MSVADLVGLPYQPRGCWELVRLAFDRFHGIALPSFASEYDAIQPSDQHRLGELILEHSQAWTRVPDGAEAAGDVVLFRIAGEPTHIGYIVGPPHFLHVLKAGHTSCIESYRHPRWRRRVEGFYRYMF